MKNNGTSRRAWLLMYQEGGWWSAAELTKDMGLPAEGAHRLHVGLCEMVNGGFVESKRQPDHQLELRVRFGVTAKCKVPRGVVLQEIESVLRMGLVPSFTPQT